jgi:3-hydroxyanthranilate 3,4-dioxygenase
MLDLPIVQLLDRARRLAETGERVSVLWQQPESLVFLARGREYRSEFHINPGDEVMFQLKGEMRVHCRTPEGGEQVSVVPEGGLIHMPAGTPHSPRFPPDAFALILERQRKPGEIDRFHWYCPSCDGFLHEESFVVRDYRDDPVSQAYARFFGNPEFRTCKACGHLMPSP